MDVATCHWTVAVQARLKELNIHKCCIPKSLTFRFQCIDVIVVALWKSVLYNLWSKWMVDSIRAGRYMEGSWNYIAPSRTQVLRILAAWEGPESSVTTKAIKKGARLCYMDDSLDEIVSAWDNCEKNEDLRLMIGKRRCRNCPKLNNWLSFIAL